MSFAALGANPCRDPGPDPALGDRVAGRRGV